MTRSMESKHSDYFEAVIQLRNVSEEVYYFAKGELEKANVHIAKIKEVKNGKDLFIADNNFAKSLGKRLQARFGGDCKITASLFSQKDGKDIYRLTVLFRGIPFKKGELVEYNGEPYKIKILGKDIMLQEEKTGKKVHLKYKDMDKIRKRN